MFLLYFSSENFSWFTSLYSAVDALQFCTIYVHYWHW